jgi:dipeptidase E
MTGIEQLLLLSTSTLHGGEYLEYAQAYISELFKDVNEILFIPYARPSLLSHEAYTEKVRAFFATLGIGVKGLHETYKTVEWVQKAEGLFVGGGNTFVLLKRLQEEELLEPLREKIAAGTPYMGSSAGTNLVGVSIGTTNDMPIVWPRNPEALGILPFNFNPHYLDPHPNSTHMGETRETRIKEFHGYQTQPVMGLREGSILSFRNGHLHLHGEASARLFRRDHYPVEVAPNTDLNTLLF